MQAGDEFQRLSAVTRLFRPPLRTRREFTVAHGARTGDPAPTTAGNPGNVG
jgi:hypothetical protein